jgi:hypothetical protein
MSLRGTCRTPHDTFYTPAHAVHVLVEHAEPLGLLPRAHEVWECAAGAGHVAHVLARRGYRVFASDISPASPALHPVAPLDFLASTGPSGRRLCIVTNPPYGQQSRLIMAFLRHGLELLAQRPGSLALLLPFEFDSRPSRTALVGEHPCFVGKVTVGRRIKWVNIEDHQARLLGRCYGHV